MATYGLTLTGFVTKTLQNILDDLLASVRSAIGVLPTGALLKFCGILAERYAELWELMEVVYGGNDPDAVTGAQQDALNAITGTLRNAATASEVTLTLTGVPLTVVTAGSRAKTDVTLRAFATIADATITAVTAWIIGGGPYVVGDRRTNGGNVYIVTTAGVDGGTSGPLGTADDIVVGLGSAHWRYIGSGTGAIDAAALSITTGPIEAASGSITTIDTPIAGWSGVRNLLDADVGTDEETNEDFRVRRELELAQSGVGTADAIRAALLEVPGVTAATVFTNDTDLVNADGMLPHSVEALVSGGVDLDIATCLLNNVADGIQTVGTSTASPVDDEGYAQVIKFSRPVEKLIYVTITLVKDPAKYPLDGDTQVQNAVDTYGAAQLCGKDAVSSRLGATAFTVAGVLDVTSTLISVFPVTVPVSSTNITIAQRELAVFDSSRTIIVSSNGTS